MSDYEGKEGLARDIAKLQKLWRDVYVPAMKQPWAEFKKGKNKFHEFTNLLTESGRAEPYVFGHMVAVFLAVNALAWVGAWTYILTR
jgi:predicted phosphohydrolase